MARQPVKNDPQDMRGHALAWPELLRAGFRTELALPIVKPDSIVVCGLGGSAIGSGLIGDYLAGTLSAPFKVHRDYGVPGYVNKRTLVICVSHSGGTEETLSAYAEARGRGAQVIVVTTGGTLAESATRDKVPVVIYENAFQPRAAVPQVFGLLLKLFDSLGLAKVSPKDVEESASHLEGLSDGAEQEEASRIAELLVGKFPVVCGAGFLSEAARRWKGQVAENAKQTGFFEILPEHNHNGLVGFEYPDSIGDRLVFVLLRSEFEHPRHALRFDFVSDLLKRRKISQITVQASGPGRLGHLVSTVFRGDLASVELAYRNGVDPTPVDVITGLKEHLAK